MSRTRRPRPFFLSAEELEGREQPAALGLVTPVELAFPALDASPLVAQTAAGAPAAVAALPATAFTAASPSPIEFVPLVDTPSPAAPAGGGAGGLFSTAAADPAAPALTTTSSAAAPPMPVGGSAPRADASSAADHHATPVPFAGSLVVPPGTPDRANPGRGEVSAVEAATRGAAAATTARVAADASAVALFAFGGDAGDSADAGGAPRGGVVETEGTPTPVVVESPTEEPLSALIGNGVSRDRPFAVEAEAAVPSEEPSEETTTVLPPEEEGGANDGLVGFVAAAVTAGGYWAARRYGFVPKEAEAVPPELAPA